MDQRLIAWARAVKARGLTSPLPLREGDRGRGLRARCQVNRGSPAPCPIDPLRGSILPQRERAFLFPPLWLFTDGRRLADPREATARLPRGLAGVVLRHDNEPGRAALGREVASICRTRRLKLVVAGDARLAAALGAGVHLRGGRWPGVVRPRRNFVTSSAHSLPELRRAACAGAALVFLSPAFATASHPRVVALGPVRWAALARRVRLPVLALGGISGDSARSLPKHLCRGAGAIGALV